MNSPAITRAITRKDFASLADLVTKHKVTVARQRSKRFNDGYRVDAHATDAQIKRSKRRATMSNVSKC